MRNSPLLQQVVKGDESSPTTVPLYPQVDFPDDPGLRELPQLFDADWLWRAYRQQFGKPGTDPCQIRIRQFSHNLSRIAIVSYELEWHPDEFIPSHHFTVKIERGKPVELFRYPEDSRLPGLRTVADPETARRPISRYVLAMPPRRVRVKLIRYRPASRAVLRHSVSRVRFLCTCHAAQCSRSISQGPRVGRAVKFRYTAACRKLGGRRCRVDVGNTRQQPASGLASRQNTGCHTSS